jgi:hypothetical protein
MSETVDLAARIGRKPGPVDRGADGLTDRKREYLGIVRELAARQGFPPTVRQIMAAAGGTSPNGVIYSLRALAKRGRLNAVEHPPGSGRHRYVMPELPRAPVDLGSMTPEELVALRAAVDAEMARRDVCEHGVQEGEWCPECTAERKRARREAYGDD